MVMHTDAGMYLEIPKLLVIRGVVHICLLDIQYPPSTRNTSDIRDAPRLSHLLKPRADVSPRSVNKMYSCGTYRLLSLRASAVTRKISLVSFRCCRRGWWKIRRFNKQKGFTSVPRKHRSCLRWSHRPAVCFAFFIKQASAHARRG